MTSYHVIYMFHVHVMGQTGKFHFGYICGFGVIGCVLMYIILNLMSDESISIDRTMSILGYSLLPMVLLALINVLAFLGLFFDLR